MSEYLIFENLINARDLGGMKAAGGAVIKKGKLIRSAHMADITPSDEKIIREKVDTVIDFRTKEERAEQGDRIIDTITYIHIPVIDDLVKGIVRDGKSDQQIFNEMLGKPEQAKEYMCETYKAFTEDYALEGYSRFIRILLENHEKAVLWHCTAGKDRAGMAAAIVENILGVSEEDIVADYLETNRYIEDKVRGFIVMAEKMFGISGPQVEESLRYMMGADEDYINTFYKAVDERFGNFDNYIKDGLKLNDDDISLFREKYLVK